MKSVHLSEAVFDGGRVDLRSIKSTMKLYVLRCNTSEMVRKEIWAHLMAYTGFSTAASSEEIGMPPTILHPSMT